MKTIMLAATFAILGSFAACTDDAPPPVSDEEFAAVVEASGGHISARADQSRIDDVGTSRTRQDGSCCRGHCDGSLTFWSSLISENCRGWVVETCHRAGLAFEPGGNAWWGSCGN